MATPRCCYTLMGPCNLRSERIGKCLDGEGVSMGNSIFSVGMTNDQPIMSFVTVLVTCDSGCLQLFMPPMDTSLPDISSIHNA